ncbi:MAG: OmpH family outer membrane protein [Acidobacteriota bacterium]|nr:OmpH family outer membrane protein [Acidobacteriota bacterium]
MNSKFVFAAALVAGVFTSACVAQTSPQAPAAPATTTPQAPPPPQAIPAKIALIELTEVAMATNEGQKAVADVQKKYEPTKANLDTLNTEIDGLTKQLQSAPATMSDEEKASRARTIDIKKKQLQRDADDAQTGYSGEVQEAINKIEGKLAPVIVKYVQQNGYTMLLDNTGQAQQGGLNLLWGGTDVSQAVVDAYNATTPGISAPSPSAPSAARTRPSAPKPAAPKPAAPKP